MDDISYNYKKLKSYVEELKPKTEICD